MDNSYLAKIEIISKGIKNSVKDKEKGDMLFDRMVSDISNILSYATAVTEECTASLLQDMTDARAYRQRKKDLADKKVNAFNICKEALKDINRICEVVSVDNFIDDEKLENSKELEAEVAIIIRELYQNRHI